MNNNQKATKRALLTSVMALVMCVVMLVGTTFAWFTDTASTAVNKIVAGNLDVDIVDENGDSLDGQSLSFVKAGAETDAEADILWEPGATFFTQGFKIANKGNLALKYKVVVSGTTGDAKLLEAIEFDVVTAKTAGTDVVVSFDEEANLLPNATAPADVTTDAGTTTNYYYLRGHMKEEAGNEYKNLTLDGISITVYATQYTYEKDSFDKLYDANAGKDTAYYTLDKFNALTEIPEYVKVVYLDIGSVSLADGDVTIGNKDICDMWTWDRNTDHTVGDILEDGRKVYMVRDNDTIYSSNKAGITLYISGSVNDNPEGGLNQSDSHAITFNIPDASNVVFTNNFTVNGYFRMNTGWSDGRNLGGAVYNRTVKSVLFDHSTFNGIWIQNGGFNTNSLTLDGCTFNAYENKASANDSNPLWFCNIRTCDVTVKNCTFKASRPIKVVEQAVFGANVTITGNKFDMSLPNTADVTGTPKNDAIMFSTLIGETQWNPAGTLGNVVVSGNEVTGANALLTFFNPSQITMANGATFKVSGNNLNGAQPSVQWKSTTGYKPDFVIIN